MMFKIMIFFVVSFILLKVRILIFLVYFVCEGQHLESKRPVEGSKTTSSLDTAGPVKHVVDDLFESYGVPELSRFQLLF